MKLSELADLLTQAAEIEDVDVDVFAVKARTADGFKAEYFPEIPQAYRPLGIWKRRTDKKSPVHGLYSRIPAEIEGGVE